MTHFKTAALTGYLMLLMFSSLMRAEGPAAPSTLSEIHFRSPRGSSIVLPVYMNDNGPFDFCWTRIHHYDRLTPNFCGPFDST
jgi:hypothetical protein